MLGDGHRPEAAVARRLVEAGREQVGGEPVGDLQQPVGDGKLAARLEQAHRAVRRRGAAWSKQSIACAAETPESARSRATSLGLASFLVTSSWR